MGYECEIFQNIDIENIDVRNKLYLELKKISDEANNGYMNTR